MKRKKQKKKNLDRKVANSIVMDSRYRTSLSYTLFCCWMVPYIGST